MTRWLGVGARVVPEGDAFAYDFRVLSFRSVTGIMTRWPEAFSMVVAIWGSPTTTLGFSGMERRWPEAFSRVVPIGDSPTITLGFSGLEGRWPEAFFRVVVLCVAQIHKNTMLFDGFWKWHFYRYRYRYADIDIDIDRDIDIDI